MKKIKVMFVCMGNVCRSPTAHGIFRQLVKDENLVNYFEIESSGTHSDICNKGDASDPRTIETALKFNCDIGDLVSRQLLSSDFEYYDYLIAMDDKNIKDMTLIALRSGMIKVSKIMDYAPDVLIRNVPDPYYKDAFDQVYVMIDKACRNLFTQLKKKLEK